ncbi:MAG: peroxiredoxin [candidate division Zixibacteria bacterium]|nr:peroxiredoxin [candidate division Zixibacteria bacterium]
MEPGAIDGRIPRIGDIAPDFTNLTTQGEITFSQWQKDNWVVLFSHPADFTPICSTELTEFQRRIADFDKRKVKLIGISIDSIHSHLAWRENLAKILGVNLSYPLIADSSMKVAQAYGMIHPGASETVTVRALFVIDPARKVRAIIYYPLNVGRNVDEVVRLIDALQTADSKGVALPVNWKPGDKVVVPAPKSEKDVEERLAGPYERLDFYLCKKELT